MNTMEAVMCNKDVDVLCEFLKFPVNDSMQVFKKFATLKGAIQYGEGLGKFILINGHRSNKIVLIAHADTYWDSLYTGNSDQLCPHSIIKNNQIQSTNKDYGLGADDRAGCAIIWLLKDLGHTILITNGEEKGENNKASFLIGNNPNFSCVLRNLNDDHRFMVQLDKCNGEEYKCYTVGTDEFRNYVQEKTNYTEPDRKRSTDIVYLCQKIAGVNLSVGYHEEHKPTEYLDINEWEETLNLCRRWLGDASDTKIYERS